MTIMNMTGGSGGETYGLLRVTSEPPGRYNTLSVVPDTAVSTGTQIDKDRFISNDRMYIYSNGLWQTKPFTVEVTLAALVAKTPDGYLFTDNNGNAVWLIEGDSTVEVLKTSLSISVPSCADGGRYFYVSTTKVEELIIGIDHTFSYVTLFTLPDDVTYAKGLYFDKNRELLMLMVQGGFYNDSFMHFMWFTLSGEVDHSAFYFNPSYYSDYGVLPLRVFGDKKFNLMYRADRSANTVSYELYFLMNSRACRVGSGSGFKINQYKVEYAWLDGDYVSMAYTTSYTGDEAVTSYLKFAANPYAYISVIATTTDTYKDYSFGALVLTSTENYEGLIIDGSGVVSWYD